MRLNCLVRFDNFDDNTTKKNSMKKFLALAGIALLVACGDDVTQINQNGLEVVESVGDLPKCSGSNEGEQAYVKGELSPRICIEGEWFATKTGDASDFSCKTEELKDGSGLKIICNGDSIGVVLNGEKGKDGKNGKDGESGLGCTITDRNDMTMTVTCGDSTMTIELGAGLPKDTVEADSEKIAISLDSLVGFTQKGPFAKGSTVYLYELSDGRTLKQTNGNFTSSIFRDDGRYKFTARDLISQYAMVIVDGYYRNEVTGGLSLAPIRLKAITDMRKHSSVNVNILTHLEFERVYHLVTRGDSTGKKLTVKKAKRQAQKEILEMFHIMLDKDTDAEDMDVFGSGDADAALLAVSILLQESRSEAELIALLAEISNEIAEKGAWEGERADSIKAYMADWAFSQNLSNIRKNVEGWGLNLGGDVGNFEKFVENFIAETYEIKMCEEGETVEDQTVKNPLSKFYGKTYTCVEAADSTTDRITWIELRNNPYLKPGVEYGHIIDWRNRRKYDIVEFGKDMWMAENLDFDYSIDGRSYGNSVCTNEECPAEYRDLIGRFYTWAAAMDSAGLYSTGGVGCGNMVDCNPDEVVRGICPEGWHLPSSSEAAKVFNDADTLALLKGGFYGVLNDEYMYYESSWRLWLSTYEHVLSTAYNAHDTEGIVSNPKVGGFNVRCVRDIKAHELTWQLN